MQIIQYHFETISSTNDWAKDHLLSFPHDKITRITADVQTKARGQYGRYWHSPFGNMYASFCFFLENPETPSLTFSFATSIVSLLEQYGVFSKIKWPNDIFVNGKKIAGILCETVPLSSSDQRCGVVVGIGMNINMDSKELSLIDQPATSLFVETGTLWSPAQIIEGYTKKVVDLPCLESQ